LTIVNFLFISNLLFANWAGQFTNEPFSDAVAVEDMLARQINNTLVIFNIIAANATSCLSN
jgi:hypothetical protein